MTDKTVKSHKILSHFLDWFFNRPYCYRVRYGDGAITLRMRYQDAKSYAEMFGGVVYYDPVQ